MPRFPAALCLLAAGCVAAVHKESGESTGGPQTSSTSGAPDVSSSTSSDTGGGSSGSSSGGVDPDLPATTTGADFDELATVIEDELLDKEIPGAAVAVILDGEVVFAEGFGVRGPELDAPVDADTTFAIGSMSKALTAATLLSALADDGATTLDTPLVDVIPELVFPPPATTPLMTIETALNHTSTLPTVWASAVTAEDRLDDASVQIVTEVIPDLVTRGYDQWTLPGRAYRYSNAGFAVAGLAGERITGAAFPDALHDRVAEPLGMDRTFARSADVIAAGNYARGLITLPGIEDPVVPPTAYDAAWLRPAGGVWASVTDVARFVQFMLDGEAGVLSDGDRLAMQSAQIDTGSCYTARTYGYGLAVAPRFWGVEWPEDGLAHETPTVGHHGHVPGFLSYMFWLPELRAGYVVLHNADSGWMLQTERFIVDNLMPLPPAVPGPEIAGDPADWERWEGVFYDPIIFGRLFVGVEDGIVTMELPDLPLDIVGAFPVCRNRFWVWGWNFAYVMTFVEDEEGRPQLIAVDGLPHFERAGILTPSGASPTVPAVPPPGPFVRRYE